MYKNGPWYAALPTETNPYMVKQLTFDDFFDFHELSKAMILNRSINTDGDKVEWLKIKWLRFQKCSLNAIFYKERLLDESFKEIAVT